MSMSPASVKSPLARSIFSLRRRRPFSIGAETIVKVPRGLSVVETTFFFAPNGERRVPWSQVFRIPAVGDGERSAMATFVASTEQKSDSPVSFLQLRGVGPFAQRSKRLNRPC
ncbi:MAG: hypothetical protein M3O50_09860, partial [Myxococcota bacterium]|nr:hypothetical protein [Myxococcota bacterium]